MWRFFQILTYINFRQTNAIYFFTEALCWKYYNKPKNLEIIQFIKYSNFGFKNWKKNMKNIRIWRLFLNFNT